MGLKYADSLVSGQDDGRRPAAKTGMRGYAGLDLYRDTKERVSALACLKLCPAPAYYPGMSMLTQEEIVRLSPPERLALISALWDSLSDAEINPTPAQTAELKRRLESFEHDRLGAVNWEQLKAELASRAP